VLLHNENKGCSLRLPRRLLALFGKHPLVAFFGDEFEPLKLLHHPADAIMGGAVSVVPAQRNGGEVEARYRVLRVRMQNMRPMT
jgi:hypothetical protein